MNAELWTAIVGAVVAIATAFMGGGYWFKWILRTQLRKLTEAETLVKEADAASKLAAASVATVESYRQMVEELQTTVNGLHGDLRGAKGEISQLQTDIEAARRRLIDTDATARRAQQELDETHQLLRELQASHSVSQRELDNLSAKLHEAERHRQVCEEDRASLSTELVVLRQRLDTYARRETSTAEEVADDEST